MFVNEESIAAALVVLCELSGVTISHLCVTRTYIYRTYLIVTICIYKIIIKNNINDKTILKTRWHSFDN